ncbi:MAG: peptide chain release factor N(5)-glutamine methyltransferase [Bacteroidales bacterium]|nr:peptide chain release factor N(5)-glutamine methyltransferase [Bacteroidales bacterium]
MQIKEFVLSARESLSRLYSDKEAAAIASSLCSEYLGVQGYTYIVNSSLDIKDSLIAKANQALERLLTGEPLQYVLGYTEFYGQKYNVNPSVLIPRPETEELCRKAIEKAMIIYRKRSAFGPKAEPVRILDLCTGSGCIAWTMALNVPDSLVVGVDISAEAVKTAMGQNIKLDVHRRPYFKKADIMDADAMAAIIKEYGPFDVIVSNPPYVMEKEKAQMKKNVLDFEPALALFVPDDNPLIFYKKIAEISVSNSNTQICGLVEINEALGADTKALFVQAGFKEVEIVKDLCNKERMVVFEKHSA